VTIAEFAYRYGLPSVLRDRPSGHELLLSTSGGVTEAGPVVEPYFFSGFVTEPAVAARGMLACAAVARSRYIRDPEVTAAIRDPVVTSNQDRLRFEAFSSCCGVHARLDLLPASLDVAPTASGTTNVDFKDAMRAALAGAAIDGPLLLSVGQDTVVVDTSAGSVTERRVPMPDRWLKGFGEVQAHAQRMRLVGELSGAAAQRFIRSLPRTARRPLWAAQAGGSMSLGVAARQGAVCVAGPHRLAELSPLLRSLLLPGNLSRHKTARHLDAVQPQRRPCPRSSCAPKPTPRLLRATSIRPPPPRRPQLPDGAPCCGNAQVAFLRTDTSGVGQQCACILLSRAGRQRGVYPACRLARLQCDDCGRRF
jgi:hypothetical protein